MPGSKNFSIRARLLISASFILAAFLGLTGVALDKGFYNSVESAVHGRLQAHVYTLLAAAELQEDNSLYLPEELPEPRFSSPDSGLIAQASEFTGKSLWQSKSMLGLSLPESSSSKTGQWLFTTAISSNGRKFIVSSFVASWAGTDNQLYRFQFRVAEDYKIMQQQILKFRRSLWVWLGTAGLILLAAQGTILSWSLSPLRRAEKEITAIEGGLKKRLGKDYPKELSGLTERLNALLENSEKHLQRYRDSLGNLAHSLKTPLAVLRNALDEKSSPEKLRTTTDEQFQRMVEIIDHQLQRAATAGRSMMSEPHSVAEPLNKLSAALCKVHADKDIKFVLENNDAAVFIGDEGDFYELAGNLIDNAFKWCASNVRVTAEQVLDSDGRKKLKLAVDDDGPGIPSQKQNEVLKRGNRADSNVDGHGLGLDMVAETISLYKGSLSISTNEWGGAHIEVIL